LSLHGALPISSAGGGFAAGMVPRNGFSLTDPASLAPWLTESDIDVYVAEFTRSGFRGPLSWWRNIDRSWELMAAFDGAAVTVPALYMAGDRDFVVTVFQQFISMQSILVPKLRPTIILPATRRFTHH